VFHLLSNLPVQKKKKKKKLLRFSRNSRTQNKIIIKQTKYGSAVNNLIFSFVNETG